MTTKTIFFMTIIGRSRNQVSGKDVGYWIQDHCYFDVYVTLIFAFFFSCFHVFAETQQPRVMSTNVIVSILVFVVISDRSCDACCGAALPDGVDDPGAG